MSKVHIVVSWIEENGEGLTIENILTATEEDAATELRSIADYLLHGKDGVSSLDRNNEPRTLKTNG